MSPVHTFYYMYLSKTFSNVKNAVKSALLFYYSKDKLVTFLKAFQSKKQEPPPKPKYEFTKNLFREIINYSSNNTQSVIYMTMFENGITLFTKTMESFSLFIYPSKIKKHGVEILFIQYKFIINLLSTKYVISSFLYAIVQNYMIKNLIC